MTLDSHLLFSGLAGLTIAVLIFVVEHRTDKALKAGLIAGLGLQAMFYYLPDLLT